MLLGLDLAPEYAGTLPPAATFASLRDRFDLRRVVVACLHMDLYPSWAKAVLEAGLELEAYLWVSNDWDWPAVIRARAAMLRATPPRRLWLDLEDTSAPLPDDARIIEALAAMTEIGLSLPPGIYTAAWYWQSIPDVDVSSLAPLWAANYTTTPPDANAGFDVHFGGWVRAAAVQYAGAVTLAGLSCDLDAWDE